MNHRNRIYAGLLLLVLIKNLSLATQSKPLRAPSALPADPSQTHTMSKYPNVYDVSMLALQNLFFVYTNFLRAKNGKSELVLNPALNLAAQRHSEVMGIRGIDTNKVYPHILSGEPEPLDRLALAHACEPGRCDNSGIGENIAMKDYRFNHSGETIDPVYVDQALRFEMGHNTTVQKLVQAIGDAWMEDEPHRKILLNDHSNEVGYGIYLNEAGQLYITGDFTKRVDVSAPEGR